MFFVIYNRGDGPIFYLGPYMCGGMGWGGVGWGGVGSRI
jgi:hypothetical protein